MVVIVGMVHGDNGSATPDWADGVKLGADVGGGDEVKERHHASLASVPRCHAFDHRKRNQVSRRGLGKTR